MSEEIATKEEQPEENTEVVEEEKPHENVDLMAEWNSLNEDEVTDEVTNEVKDEVKTEIKEEIKTEIKTEIKEEVTDEKPEETTEEPVEIPLLTHVDTEKYGDVDLTSDLEVDAANFFAGGPKADWCLKEDKEKSEDEQKAFRKYQSAAGHLRTEAEKPVDDSPELSSVASDLGMFLKGEMPQEVFKEKYGVKPSNIVDTPSEPEGNIDLSTAINGVIEAHNLDDDEAFGKAMTQLGQDFNTILDEKISRVKNESQQEFGEKMDKKEINATFQRTMVKAQAIDDEYGEVFGKYVKNGTIDFILRLGHDPFNPNHTVANDDPMEAFRICLKRDGNPNKIVEKDTSSLEAVAPPGSGSGDEPEITEKDLDLPYDEYMKKVSNQILNT